jgi:hypothetical protein
MDTFVRPSEHPKQSERRYGGEPVVKLDLLCVDLARRAGESFSLSSAKNNFKNNL